jgi:hypothetical protein
MIQMLIVPIRALVAQRMGLAQSQPKLIAREHIRVMGLYAILTLADHVFAAVS